LSEVNRTKASLFRIVSGLLHAIRLIRLINLSQMSYCFCETGRQPFVRVVGYVFRIRST